MTLESEDRLDHRYPGGPEPAFSQDDKGEAQRAIGKVSAHALAGSAFGAVKSWIGYQIASNELPANRRLDFDTTITALALTAKEMNSKYKETSEGGLAVSVVPC